MNYYDRFCKKKKAGKDRLSSVFTLAVLLGLTTLFAVLPLSPGAYAAAPVLQGSFDAKSSFYQAGITASDINGDGISELLVGNQNGRLYCFNPDAEIVWEAKIGSSIQGTPACYDVDGDGKQEVWIGDMDGRMWGFDCEGRTLTEWGWPRQTITTGGLNSIFSSPAVGDINGDGLAEIVVGTHGQMIYAWTYTGQLLPGWPFNNEDTIWSSPALADMDWDGIKEVVIGADSTGGPNWPYPPGGLLYVLDEDASVLPGFPRYSPEVTWSSPAVFDMDGDARYEIVVGTGHYYTTIGQLTNQGNELYAYHHDGTDVWNWPVNVVGPTFSSPAVGDVDGDGAREVVVGTMNVVNNEGVTHGSQTVSVIELDGTIVQQIIGHGGPILGSPVLGDVSGDGVADIILGSGQRLYAWNGSGSVLWSINLNNFIVGNQAVGDFDRDGNVEVAVATGDAPGGSYPGGKFYVYDCGKKASGGSDRLLPWQMFRHAPDHHATLLNGAEPPPPPPASAVTWYLAEGSTAGGMETWVLVQNPGDENAEIRLTYMTSEGPISGPVATLAPHTRKTFNAAETVPDKWEVSTMVSSDEEIVAERAVYGGNRTWATDSVGVSEARKKWYLAEGCTNGGMETWVLVQNPNTTAASVSLSFQTDAGQINGPGAVIPAYSRVSFNLSDYVPGYWGVSTKVEADRPVVAERSMFGNGRTWATDSIGANLPATAWYLAEGSTGPGMETWLLIQNPTHPDANVHIDYMTPNGAVTGPSFAIKAGSRMTVYAGNTVEGESSLSSFVTSDIPVIAERSMYGNGRAWATDSIGSVTPAEKWCLAEGSTGPGMETWITVQNPNDEEVNVTVEYMTGNGPVKGPVTSMPPRSRSTFFVADTIGSVWDVSTTVTADAPVVVERAMYGGNRTWGHESIGFTP
ncbi:MAG: VCBS repeat-containing protein [Actinobacteria bacterium]|nr:VCBS repeat-containing protein [Actinomycetota bacterium]